MSHGFVVVFIMALFAGMHFYSIFVLERVSEGQVNLHLYLLGVFIAGLLSYPFKEEKIQQTTMQSFLWVTAVRKSNYQTAIIALLIFAIVFTTKDKAISRIFVGSYILSAWFSLIIINRYVPDWIAGFAFRGRNSVRTIFLGSAKSARRLEQWAERQPFFGIDILGLITYEMATDLKLKMPIIGEFMDMELIMEAYKVDQIVLLETRNSDWWIDPVVELCEKHGCRILIFNPWEEYFDQELLPVQLGGHTFFTLQEEPLENPINRAMKRILDIVVSLPVVLFVLPLLCLLVKCMQLRQAPGPLFFKQERSGQRGRRFKIYKFRSMRDAGTDRTREGEQAKEGDDRIFPFGQIMRKTSIDEFPQFINVLLGQMSTVGPRPHLLEHDDQFSQQVNIYRTRHFVKPGITGLAQSKGFRGEITDRRLIEERVHYDLQYIRGWSIWLDLLILFKTAVQILRPPKSAY
ncbi:exopolysaccharide biosynthesis polyprenyl glycosylphosphotransferase [Coraliomargarita sinensis]|uniref:exopolysaccharide biosynthesis polyprenyl glycosylphosphotransferase n=1 Tax=Coraliomargarita sinensis TaxID=2174842 RepID=UPI001304B2DB|nr:exopolysaccharide biosynthesis polyprenyl glycosylphosphotransferase [Coraliomargarita sinensis]